MAEKVRTFVEGLDGRMEGGIPPTKLVLVSGPAGSLKTSLIFNILYHNSRDGRKAMFLTLEQGRESLYKHMSKMGIDVDDKDPHLSVLDLAFLRKELTNAGGDETDWLEFIQNIVVGAVKNQGVEIIGIDSLNAIYAVSEMPNPRKTIFMFFEKMRELGATTFFTSEAHEENELAFYGVEEFLADGIIQMSMERTGRSISRFIRVVKLREVNHSTDYFPLIIEKGKMHIVTR